MIFPSRFSDQNLRGFPTQNRGREVFFVKEVDTGGRV
jgi:hypothetical protein